MRVQNDSGLVLGWTVGSFEPPRLSAVLIVKGTFALQPDGQARLLEEQPELSPETYDEIENLLYDSDFALFKPRADVMFSGSCHAPKGKPTDVCRATFGVGKWSKSLAVIGDRVWKTRFLMSTMSPPEPFTRVPIRYDRAFGGAGYAKNPIGRGFVGNSLPNVEAIDNLVRSPEDRRDPAGFGPIPRSWPQRWKKAGSYGKDWLSSRWPWFPKDFDWSHFNSAPEDQQFPEPLRGDETLLFENLHRVSPYRAALPGVSPRLTENQREVPLRLDTLFADLERERVTLVWRGRVETSEWDLADLGTLRLSTGEPSKPEEEPEPAPDVAAALAAIDDLGEPEGWTREKVIAHREGFADEDLTGLDLSGLDFAGRDFRGAILSRSRLRDSMWAGAELSGAILSEAGLAGADFSGARLAGADLSGADLSRANLAKADLRGADLTGAKLYRTDLRDADAGKAVFADADLQEADLRGGKFASADFTEARLVCADGSGADFTEASFFGARGAGAVMRGANLTKLRAPDAPNFDYADFREVSGEGSTWQGASLVEANFSNARLKAADFLEADLRKATFLAADLREARFREAALVGADLGRANLFKANFQAADLTGASLFGSNAYGIDLWDAIVEQTDFREAKRTKNAIVKARVYRPRS